MPGRERERETQRERERAKGGRERERDRSHFGSSHFGSRCAYIFDSIIQFVGRLKRVGAGGSAPTVPRSVDPPPLAKVPSPRPGGGGCEPLPGKLNSKFVTLHRPTKGGQCKNLNSDPSADCEFFLRTLVALSVIPEPHLPEYLFTGRGTARST